LASTKNDVRQKAIRAVVQRNRARRTGKACGRLLLPSAFLVAIQAQLLAPFVAVDLCLAAFFD
jgi:hypothetical protein